MKAKGRRTIVDCYNRKRRKKGKNILTKCGIRMWNEKLSNEKEQEKEHGSRFSLLTRIHNTHTPTQSYKIITHRTHTINIYRIM